MWGTLMYTPLSLALGQYSGKVLGYLCAISLLVVMPALSWALGQDSSTNSLARANVATLVFNSELAAVEHAMNTYNPVSIAEDREYIGAIYRLHSGSFIYSVAPGQSGSDQVSAAIPKIPTGRFVAFWHTHGAAHYSRRYFSDIDTELVEQWQLPFYLGSADGKLRIFKPGERTLSFRRARRDRGRTARAACTSRRRVSR